MGMATSTRWSARSSRHYARDVAGHSLGRMIAIKLAARHLKRVDRLAVLSAAAGRTEEERRRVMDRIDLIASGIPGDHFNNSLQR